MPTTDELIDASVFGRAARRSGESRNVCPHPIGTGERRYWLMGWDTEDRRVHPLFEQILAAHGVAPVGKRSAAE